MVKYQCDDATGVPRISYRRYSNFAVDMYGRLTTVAKAKRSGGPYGVWRCKPRVHSWDNDHWHLWVSCYAPFRRTGLAQIGLWARNSNGKITHDDMHIDWSHRS